MVRNGWKFIASGSASMPSTAITDRNLILINSEAQFGVPGKEGITENYLFSFDFPDFYSLET